MAQHEPGRPVLRLERSRTARAFVDPESLWKNELEQIYELIGLHVQALKEETQNGGNESVSSKHLPVLSIAVFGTYGSGKTSLLKTLADNVNGKQGPGNLSLFSLPVIEPNILAKDEHFLYTFLATALEEDLKRTSQGERRSHALSRVQQVFQEVSEYLQVIDQAETPQEHDPLGLSLERLERHTSGLLLREKLTELLDRLADGLAGPAPSVVLLPVDDADMSQETLISALDTFQRYLQHPRLIPVFAFTGRLAEELLQVRFARNLIVPEGKVLTKELAQSSAALEMVEHLAVQYMVKLFPIRNRIRLGPAPARVQAAKYRVHEPGRGAVAEKSVWFLLEVASNLLFGHPEYPIAPRVRLALRPSTLRRQLQVLDAMYDSKVGTLAEALEQIDSDNGEENQKGEAVPAWIKVFDNACWSLLNVHRDVLRSFGLYIEELYSLTPRNLSRAVLNSLLSLNLELRRELIQRWRFQVEDRKGQVLSLLALNAFRPQVEGEEPSGDDPDAVRAWFEGGSSQPNGPMAFSAMKGLIWFLDLWIGFYLPQILARNRPNDIIETRPELGSIRGVGWTLRSGPVNAAREVLGNDEFSATGMMRLDPQTYADTRDKLSTESSLTLAARLWCFYGYRGGEPWVVVSFWRGLGLIGQLLEDYERLRVFRSKDVEEVHLRRIGLLIRSHCTAAGVPGSFQEGHLALGKWIDPAEEVESLAKEFQAWIRFYSDEVIRPFRSKAHKASKEERESRDATLLDKAFKNSFIRRLHGEYLLGNFWSELGGAYLEGVPDSGDEIWNAWAALTRWTSVLVGYWDPDPSGEDAQGPQQDGKSRLQMPLREMLRTCPLLRPFIEGGDAVAGYEGTVLWKNPDRLRDDFFRKLERASRPKETASRQNQEASAKTEEKSGRKRSGPGKAGRPRNKTLEASRHS